ncbi:nucleotide exchange factor GrpE [Candidatus Aciduliprofundum boonei]|uniref:Protein GrpE n=1 Tax=Aciduliprofundum boonei (strain DSM 19572 / T469) TaxID=439481 RepID=B5ICS2_ACIB4|nr:nucleotide exchange factor GrpE [Candidatus Aciduliprofundum boonei]ADD09155.1 GrpE protein [Aciduliprofundum boonei T469]EDY35974.1 co-chaperone GrpE [Aciduliprofundum boonei T469]HII55879.1 nucleotide exchange factor GrpE [Candidatus Aciduliprofundum boonei]
MCEDIEKIKKERDEYKDKYLRKLAEMDNYRKMMEREKNMEIERCRIEIIKEFLEPYESLRKAVESIPKNMKDGIELILKQMEKIMKNLGLREIEAIGKKFDPMLHEAIGVVEGDEDDIVVEEYQKGYMLGDIVLRHSKVLVSKKEVNKDE